MKRIFFLILLLAVTWQAAGQRPVITFGSAGYMFEPPVWMDSIQLTPRCPYSDKVMNLGFMGNAYRPGHPITVYGLAVTVNNLELFPYLWVYMLQDRRLDSTSFCYAVDDTVAAELFCFMEQPPVSYADFSLGGGDTHVFPYYEFYFSHPVQVNAGQRFFIGICHSQLNVYNHYKKDDYYWPHGSYSGPFWHVGALNRVYNHPENPDSTCIGDRLDSTWSLWKRLYPGRVDWTCDRCTDPSPYLGGVSGWCAGYTGYKYSARGLFPIIRPPEDSTRIFPRHDHPLRAEAVRNFRLTELDSAHASFAWDTFPPSDWGPVGVNVNAYQVNYAPYMQEYAEGDTLVTAGDGCALHMAFDSTVMYKARCRARSRHMCDIHDTMVWGEWSSEVYFHTGVGVPDTMPLECRRVEGLRYEGLVGGNPRISWEPWEGHDFYEVQYAAVGGPWHRAPNTNTTTCVLYAEWVPGTRYMARVRGKCSHQCHIHDMLMVGEWSDTVEFALPEVGVETAGETEEGGLFALAPNPTKGSVTVRPAARGEEYPAVLTVSDAKGREVLRHTLTDGSPVTLALGTLPSGAYLVTLTTRSHQTGTRRLVVE